MRDPYLVYVFQSVKTDPDRRPPGVYGSDIVFEGNEPDPRLLAWATRPAPDGSKPLIIILGPETIEPPKEEPDDQR